MGVLSMKKHISTIGLVALVTIGTVGSVSAYTINSGGTNVGGLDTLLHSDALVNSGDATEIAWVNTKLGTSFTAADFTKTEGVDSDWTWYVVDGDSDKLAFDLLSDGGYFFVKTGNYAVDGLTKDQKNFKLDLPSHFLYSNEASSDWGVVSLSKIAGNVNTFLAINGYSNVTVKSFDVTKFSHVGEFGGGNGGGDPVPEPTTMLLFGAGLAGLAGVSRKGRKEYK
jgi:hypothetical protein